ncbi:hypothetical protein D3C85_1746250 [compost metagenome]
MYGADFLTRCENHVLGEREVVLGRGVRTFGELLVAQQAQHLTFIFSAGIVEQDFHQKTIHLRFG